MYPKYGIVRKPSNSFTRCISSNPQKYTINIENALEQHSKYCEILKEFGIELLYLPIDNNYPDSCFVEDHAVIHNNKAFITRMGAESRRGEENELEAVLKEFKLVERAESPATLEGGDVIHTPSHLISGITQRTNQEGAAQMGDWLDVKVDTCIDPNIVHLKSYVTYLGNNQLLCTVNYAKHSVFEEFEKIFVSPAENYAANCLIIGNSIIMPSGFPKTKDQLESHGYEVIDIKINEFKLCEGALTCLSLLF